MQALLQPVRNPHLDRLSPGDTDVLLANARLLGQATAMRQTATLLRGKNLGLLCESEDAADALRFCRAAKDLGAHVAHIRPSLSELSEPRIIRRTARMLGRLYDAVECQGLPAELVKQIADEAGVPVYAGVATADHPTAALAGLLGDSWSPADNRHLVLQAALVGSLS